MPEIAAPNAWRKALNALRGSVLVKLAALGFVLKLLIAAGLAVALFLSDRRSCAAAPAPSAETMTLAPTATTFFPAGTSAA